MAEEAIIKRVMPSSLEAEQAVIGSILINQEAITTASEIVNPEDFYNKQYGILFEAMIELNKARKQVDVVTLMDKLKEKDVPQEVLNFEYLRDIIAAVPTSQHVNHYAAIVAEKALLRRLIKTTEEIENNCFEGKESLEYILDDTEKKVYNIVQRRGSDEFEPIDKAVIRAVEGIEAAYRAGGSITGIPTGFIDLDFMTSGFHGSELILIAARPAMGKTAFVLNIAQHMAFRKNKSVAIFSLEMGKEQLLNRLFALEGNIEAGHLRNGKLDDYEWDKLAEASSVIGDSRLIIDDTASITVQQLRSKCRKYKLEKGLDIIIIDYLQLMSGSGRIESRQQEISEIQRDAHIIARIDVLPGFAALAVERDYCRPSMNETLKIKIEPMLTILQ